MLVNKTLAKPHHPVELPVLFLTEMWERFSFYLMLGILPLYLADSQKGGLGWTDEQAAVALGSYTALVYFTPFIGGRLADRLFGLRNTVLLGATLMMIGHLVLAWPTRTGLFLGLAFLICGNGAFKPNISTLLGNLYPPGSPLKDSGYSIFYVGVNLGAFICNFVAAMVRNYFDAHPWTVTSGWVIGGWHGAFGTAAVGMFLGLTLFALNYRRLARGESRESARSGGGESLTPLWFECLLPAVILGAVGWFATHKLNIGINAPTGAFLGACVPVVVFYLRIWRGLPTDAERSRVGALLVVFLVSIVFWTTYGLNTTALNVWTRDNTDRRPNGAVSLITERFKEFAENAPPDYFTNASPDVARPAKDSFEIVSPERYKELKEKQALNVVEDKHVYVTQGILDNVYEHTRPETPILPEGKHLKVVNSELFQSIDPGVIILMTPIMVALWGWLRRRGLEPDTPLKIGLSLFIIACSPLIMLGATYSTQDGQMKGTAWWLIGTYAMVAMGEIFMSPIGLSLVNKMAPARISAFMMGGWFLATSCGLKISGILGETYQKVEHKLFWTMLVAANVFVGIIVLILLPWLRRQIAETDAPSPSKPE